MRAIALGIEADGIGELHTLYNYDGSDAFVTNYTQWDDAKFMLTFGDPRFQGKYCYELVDRLRRRRLIKQVFESRVSALPESCRDVVQTIANPKNRKERRSLEEKITTVVHEAGVRLNCKLGDPSNLVIANSYTLKSVRAQSRNDEGPILVRKGKQLTTFEEESDLFRSINEKLVDPRFAIYAPVDYENPTERRALQIKLQEPILKCLEGFGNGK